MFPFLTRSSSSSSSSSSYSSSVYSILFQLLLLFLFRLSSSTSTPTTKTDDDANSRTPSSACRQRWLPDSESFVCVCDAEYCDEAPEAIGRKELEDGQILLFTSTKQEHRLHKSSGGKFTKVHQPESTGTETTEGTPQLQPRHVIKLNISERFQTLLGFGGAFSDAAGLNLNALSWSARERLLAAYFDARRGIGYRLGRVPIASTDFSTREYSYADVERDFELEHFALAPEDLEAKIPHIKMAARMAGSGASKLQLFAAAWASPGWMKSNGRMSGDGQLKGELDGPYYRTYAHYLKRFFDEYAARGIEFWALTLQNQPESGLEKDFPFQTMFMSNHTQREFAARLLVPLLKQSPHTANLQLIAFDDVREHLVASVREIFSKDPSSSSSRRRSLFSTILCSALDSLPSILPEFASESAARLFGCQKGPADSEGADLIAGIGIHWYMLDGHEAQSQVHQLLPDKFILATEACAGFLIPDDCGPQLGNWTRGWQYGHDIVQNLRNWAIGWVDWNLCLDEQGGPNWVQNHVDAPILVNAAKDEFYKQPMFYWLAHFSRFVPPGSVRVASEFQRSDGAEEGIDEMEVENVAFVTPEGHTVLVLIAPPGVKKPLDLLVRDVQRGVVASIQLEPASIVTAVWT